MASPYPLEMLKGNVVTARRIASLLVEAGLEARVSYLWDGEEADVLIALHAVKGAEGVFRFKEAFPRGKVVSLLTGTDLYEMLPGGSRIGHQVLGLVDRIVVMTESAIEVLPAEVREKVVVIRKSLEPFELGEVRTEEKMVISVLGHLRPVKRPFATIEAVSKHPEWEEVRVWQIGEALGGDSERLAREWEKRDSRYRWWGGLPRNEGVRLCAAGWLTVNSSLAEGASNAILEAMTLGVPVLASKIPGNIGLLGEGYSGYFEEADLEVVLGEIVTGNVDLKEWVAEAKERLGLFSREAETNSWLELLSHLNY